MKKTLMTLCAISLHLFAYGSWYEQKLEGWYYFEDKSEQKEKTLSPAKAEQKLLIEARKLKQLLSLAILAPSEDNVFNYIQAQKRLVEQSSYFANTWGKVLLSHPELGDFLTTPTSSYGILAKRDYDVQKRKRLLEDLSKTHFLLVFFEGKSPFAPKVVEVAKLFAEANAWSFKAVSLDGVGIEGLQNYELDKGISKLFNITVSPALFVVDPKEAQVHPVGVGLLSVSDIEKNIELQLGDADE